MPRAKKQRLKKRPDGRYVCRYKELYFYGETEDEALANREQYKKAEEAGMLSAIRPVTVAEYAQKWLPLYKSGVSDKCYNDYAVQLEKLLPVIGNKAIADVTVDDAANVWTQFDGMSASTIHRAKMLYVALWEAAIENDLCRKNPFKSKSAQPPKAPAGSHRALTRDEIQLIVETPHRFQPAVMVMLYAGLRRGEVLALDMSDVDLAAGVIHVNKAVRFRGNRPEIVSPKTAAGVRDVPILSPLRPVLASRIGRIAECAHGGIMTDRAFKRAWESYLLALKKAAGKPVTIRPHDLRHTYCTMLRDAGVDLKQAMLWLGHADEKMILKIYDHVSDERTRRSIGQVEKMLIGGQNGGQF